MIEAVVGIGAVCEHRESARLGHALDTREQLVLAVEAAVGAIRAIARIIHLVCRHGDEGKPVALEECDRIAVFGAGE